MNTKQMLDIISNGSADALENQWLTAIEGEIDTDAVTEILQAAVKADMLNTAESMAWALIELGRDKYETDPMLEIAIAALHGVPQSDQLREQVGELFRKKYGENELFEEMLKACGILTGQSPRRAVRTMQTCMAIQPGDYLVNRFDNRTLKLVKYDDIMEEFELTDSRGMTEKMIPREMADEFDPADPDDFRIMSIHNSEKLKELVAKSPAEILCSLCKAHGGEINANEIKEALVPKLLEKSKWSSWWSRARTASKKSDTLSLSTDRPVIVSYHEGGRSLDEELADQAQEAITPALKLELLRTYARELKTRNQEAEKSFVDPIVQELIDMTIQWIDRRPSDALCAALALEEIQSKLKLTKLPEDGPSSKKVIAMIAKPSVAISHLEDKTLWAGAFKALSAREDCEKWFDMLDKHTPASLMDKLAKYLSAEKLSDLASRAMAEPLKYLEVCIWLWKGTKKKIEDGPSAAEVFRRFMNILAEVEQDLEMPASRKRDTRQAVRSALNASNYKRFREAMAEVDDAVAATMLNQIKRAPGLGEAAEHELPGIIREHHYALFLEKKLRPWEDKNAIYSTQNAINKREDELKELVDVKMLENAKAIGAAAEHGDLSENSEWKFAIEERDLLRAQAAKMQDQLSRAKVIDFGECGTSEVIIGSKVTLTSEADGHEVTLTLLGPWESDLENNVFNYLTQLGSTLLGKNVGDVVELKFEGAPASYKITKTGPSNA